MKLPPLAAGAIIAALVMLGGVFGFVVLEGYTFLEAVYFTVISLTTVGYGLIRPLSHAGLIFTSVLLIIGVGLILFIATRINETLIEGNIRRVLGRRKMDRSINRLKGHFIICGYGRLGQKVDSILRHRGMETVVIERNPATTAKMEEEGRRYILGQATEDQMLVQAGIQRAGGLVAGVNSDADNLYIVLSAREMRPDLFILARSSDPAVERKMLRAGADKVVSPIEIGARRMAQSILQPNVTDFLDLAVADDRQVPVQMEELTIGPASKLAGVALKDSGIRADLNLIVVAIREPDQQMKFNPGPADRLQIGQMIIVIGPADKLDRLAELLDAQVGRGEDPGRRWRHA